MIIPVIWKTYNENGIDNRGYWDQSMLEAIFNEQLWQPIDSFAFGHHSEFPPIGSIKGAIVIIPARHNFEFIKQINKDINHLEWCLLILTGDEEGVFPVHKIKHPNIKIWVQTPQLKQYKNVDRFLINGWSPRTRKLLSKSVYKEGLQLDYFFAGQVTHKRRIQAVEAMKKFDKGENRKWKRIETYGFTKGESPEDYFDHMAHAKLAPCPSGAVIPDSFRFAEALEAGCVPLVDATGPNNKLKNYWQFVFGVDNLPFPIIQDWKDLPGHMQYHLDVYPQTNNRCYAWWQQYKRQMVYNLNDDLHYLMSTSPKFTHANDRITVLMPTSPIKAHPDTSMIEETIKSVRDRLPTAEIIIMIDGIREEQKDMAEQYNEYVRRLLVKCNFEWKNVVPLLFNEHTHQAGMTMEAIKQVKTPTILFVEHDAPLCETIPFMELTEVVMKGDANLIRLHHEALILPDHKHLMLDKEPQIVNGIPLVRTAQWSQRPHVASTEFYKNILRDYFSRTSKTMIEDVIHGPAHEAYIHRGKVGWNDWKLWIYAPERDMKRSYHLDGRGTDPKFEMIY